MAYYPLRPIQRWLTDNHFRRAAVETKQATDEAQKGAEVVDRTIKDMARLSEVVGESARVVNSLGERSDTIGKITDDISQQLARMAGELEQEVAKFKV